MISLWRRAAGDALKRAAHTSRSYHTIEAIPREFTGKRLAVKERAQGRIPAVVLALDDAVGNALSRKYLITTEKDQIQSVIDTVQLPFFCSTTFSLQIRAGSGSSTVLESGNVLPIKVTHLFNDCKCLCVCILGFNFVVFDCLIRFTGMLKLERFSIWFLFG